MGNCDLSEALDEQAGHRRGECGVSEERSRVPTRKAEI